MYVFTLVFGVVLWITVLSLYIRRPAASAFHPMTFMLIFQFIVFVLRPILAYIMDFHNIYVLYDFIPTDHTKVVALLVADLTFVIFAVTSLRWGNLPVVIKLPKIDATASHRYMPAFLVAAAIVGPVGAIALRGNIQTQSVGSTTMIMDAATGNAINTSGNGYFDNMVLCLATLVVVFAWINRFRLLSLIPYIAYVLLRGSTGGRFPFVMATASLLLFYLWEKRYRWFSLRLVWPAIAVFILFTTIGLDRGATLRSILLQDKNQIAARSVEMERPLESMDYGNLEFSEYIIQTVPDKTGTYDYFASNLILFTGPIPRYIWPQKPVGSPIKYFSWFDYGNPVGMTMSLGGWGWYELGWLGVIVWTGLSGIAYGWIYNRFMKSGQNVYQVAAYIITIPMSIYYFRDGSFPEMVNFIAFDIIPLIVWFGVASLLFKKNRPRFR